MTMDRSLSRRSSRSGAKEMTYGYCTRSRDARHRTVILNALTASYRRAVLDAYIFRTIDDVRLKTEEWNEYYNFERPHESLENMTPMEYRAKKEEQDD